MKIINRLESYLSDNEYRIILRNSGVNIVNYDEIINFSSTQISIRIKNKILIFEGNNLVITKMLDDEILITGNITNIRINK
ncbi:MAG: YabP/YqfC family sporulation protein [Mycoplasmatota bacterium]|nr:YabP/YqfC family sporulation protein [Mycoplasmatota bacterium]